MAELLYSPKQAADALGVSGAALRRASAAYEAAFGDLKRDARGGRQFTAEAVDRLRLAFGAVHAGRVASVEVALTMLRDEGDLPVLDPPAPRTADAEALVRAVAGEIVGELRAHLQVMREENAALRSEVAALRELVAGQGRELPAPGPSADELREIIRAEIGAALVDRSPTAAPVLDSNGVRLAVRDELETLRVRLHASARAPRQGWLTRLWAFWKG